MMKSLFLISAEILFRLVIGYLFISSGWGKLHDLNKVIQYFDSLHIPLASIQAPLVAGIEFAAGLLILLGLKMRLAAIPLIGIMVVALVTAKLEDISNFSSLIEIPEFLYLLLLIGIGSIESKYFSFDSRVAKKRSSLQT